MGFGFFNSLLILILFFWSSVSQNPNTDEFFLYNFLQRMGLNSTKGYDFSGSFCSWKGVSCNANGENVVKLQASGLGLSGVIADNTIGKLKNLEFLDLSCNEITGLSTDFWSLSSLKILNLSLNQISGILPSNIGNFGQLQIFDLSDNVFSGIIPEAISSLVSLQVLNLSKNMFESNIPLGISQCHWITSIDLARNKLNGSLPSGLLSALPMLRFLNLADNEIDGRDSDFSGMKMISYLNISGNLFKGSVVGVFTGPLEEIDLSRNQFDGHISQVNFVSTFNWSHVVYLDLSENQFSGQFFTELNHAENLKHLNLAHNRFTKQPFLEIDKLSNLEYLNLSATNLVGRIPSNVSRLSSLRMLDLSKNHLTNHIPWFSTKNLRVLDVSYNNLTGEIPLRLLQDLPKMERFNFSYNELSFCAKIISPETTQAAFIGSVNSCPIAANPAFFKRKARKHRGLELALVLALSMVCLLVGLLFLAFGCRRRSRMWGLKGNSCKEEQTLSGPFSFHTDSTTWVADVKQAISIPVVIFEKPLLNFTFADLLSATAHFDSSALLAEGRFGPVYDGVLPGGVHIAVKVLVCGSTMIDQEAAREFEYLGRVKHPNLVPLMGYCLAGEQRIAIYDCTENGNLHNLLYNFPLDDRDRDRDRTTEEWSSVEENEYSVQPEGTIMTWQFRHKIALGVARALAFLHHGCSPPIIHRDVKPSSVYLDSYLEPRLSDFGLAKIFGDALDDESEYRSTGYLPPELVKTESGSPQVPTTKSDVYGFGVILLELITGRKPVGDDYDEEKDSTLVSWVRRLVRENKGSRALDPKISGVESEERLVEALKIGYLCTAELPSKRPSMQQVVGLLKDIEPHPPE